MKRIRRRIRQLRERHAESLEHLGLAVGVSCASMSCYERGYRMRHGRRVPVGIPVAVLKGIAIYYGVSLAYFLGKDDIERAFAALPESDQANIERAMESLMEDPQFQRLGEVTAREILAKWGAWMVMMEEGNG